MTFKIKLFHEWNKMKPDVIIEICAISFFSWGFSERISTLIYLFNYRIWWKERCKLFDDSKSVFRSEAAYFVALAHAVLYILVFWKRNIVWLLLTFFIWFFFFFSIIVRNQGMLDYLFTYTSELKGWRL